MGVTGEWANPGQGLIGNDAERINVGCRSCLFASCLLWCKVLHGAHDLAGRGQRNLVGYAGDAKVGDLDLPGRGYQQIARFYVAVNQTCYVGLVKSASRLGNNVHYLFARQSFVALKNLGKRVTGHELHHQKRTARIFAIVKHVGNALVVNHGSVTGFGSKALQEPRVTHVFGLQNLDGDVAQNYLVVGLPNLTHATDGDARLKAITPAIQAIYFWLHLCNTACITFRAIGAASELPRPF